MTPTPTKIRCGQCAARILLTTSVLALGPGGTLNVANRQPHEDPAGEDESVLREVGHRVGVRKVVDERKDQCDLEQGREHH